MSIRSQSSAGRFSGTRCESGWTCGRSASTPIRLPFLVTRWSRSHDESDLGHEEVYVVLTGRATFTVDGEELDVPAGSLVHIADPTLRRHAVAAEPSTTVLAIGGKPGEPFRPSAWEHYFEAGAAQAAGDAEGAYRIAAAGLVDHPDHPALLFNIACYAALAGHPDDAIAMLRRALDVAPDRVRAWAADDSDLDSLRDRPDWPLQ